MYVGRSYRGGGIDGAGLIEKDHAEVVLLSGIETRGLDTGGMTMCDPSGLERVIVDTQGSRKCRQQIACT